MMTTTINTVPETPDEPQTAGEDEAAIPIETCDEPSSEQECSEAAKAAGVLEGGAGYPFAGNWKTRGCYAYAEGSGTYAGRAYWGVNTDGIEPTASKGRYRVCMPSPTTTTMTALPSTTTTTNMPASRTCDPNPCKNGASCSGDGVCTCKGDFVGIDCAVPRGCSDQAVSDDHWLHSPCAHVNTALPYPKEADAVPEEPTR